MLPDDVQVLNNCSWLVHVGSGTALRVELPAGYPASQPPCALCLNRKSGNLNGQFQRLPSDLMHQLQAWVNLLYCMSPLIWNYQGPLAATARGLCNDATQVWVECPHGTAPPHIQASLEACNPARFDLEQQAAQKFLSCSF